MNNIDRAIMLLIDKGQGRLAASVGDMRAALKELIEAVEEKRGVEQAVAGAKDVLRDDPA